MDFWPALLGAVVGGTFSLLGVLVSQRAAHRRLVMEQMARECRILADLLRQFNSNAYLAAETHELPLSPDYDIQSDRIRLWCRYDRTMRRVLNDAYKVLMRRWSPSEYEPEKERKLARDLRGLAHRRFSLALAERIARLPYDGELQFYRNMRELVRYGEHQSNQEEQDPRDTIPPSVQRYSWIVILGERLRAVFRRDIYSQR